MRSFPLPLSTSLQFQIGNRRRQSYNLGISALTTANILILIVYTVLNAQAVELIRSTAKTDRLPAKTSQNCWQWKGVWFSNEL